MSYQYSIQDYSKEHMARAHGLLPISEKKAIEICNFIRDKNLPNAKKLLEGVIEKKVAVPIKRYKRGIPHRVGIGPGKYPLKAGKFILELLNSAEANAQFKGLNSANLIIKHISAKKGNTARHIGRKRARQMKRCIVEVVLSENNDKLLTTNHKRK